MFARRVCGSGLVATSFARHQSQKVQGDVIGIDLGTTNSCVATMDGDKPRVLENAEGFRTTPSVVAFKGSEKLVGLAAKRQAITNPASTFFAVKRLIGRRFNDEHIQHDVKNVPYKIVRANNGDAWVQDANGKQYSPSQVGAFVLEKMKESAEAFLHRKVTNAVVTCPAYFNDAQRQATKDAGTIAGLNVLRVINEPTAAAIAFGVDKTKDHLIAVYDLGGGTFDISVLEIAAGVFEVKATNGDTHLGGEDFDLAVSDYILQEFKKTSGIDLSKERMALQRVREAAEKAKCELSSAMETEVNLPFISVGADGPEHIEMKITRAKFEEIVAPYIERTFKPCKQVIRDAGVDLEEISEVVLVGGMTRMPRVIDTVREFFKKEPFRGVNPDEAVALGAATLGGVLRGEVKGLILVDVTPLSLGTSIVGDVFVPIIPKNTAIPCKRSHTFTTVEDGQTAINFQVYQGEREIASKNQLMGQFDLNGIIYAPRSVPKIEVIFDIDANGICHVTAQDKATGRKQGIIVTANGGLTQEQIDRMVRDAEQHAKSDRERKLLVEARNNADNQINMAEKQLKDWKYVSQEQKDEVKKLMEETRKVMNNTNATKEDIKDVSDKLQKALMDGGRAEYEQSAAASK
ncbi:molecular chaperone DnaK [Strigomonas culicis]|uniref:Molecular chaperone DnaK n=1 Tax=Strigomonas culicis TaxID=28005 RepID=S9V7W6_9TRYP|nr:molecular chaperone DnaK [Strigomonas culicis]|eukprot:EPY19050.1 molecular chaperone DnaK [Strigomonas culicis]